MNIFRKAGLSNFPDATKGKFESKNFTTTGILKAASLLDKNSVSESLSKSEPSLKKIA